MDFYTLTAIKFALGILTMLLRSTSWESATSR